MSGDDRPRSIAEMPVQRPATPATTAEGRGRFFNTGNGFNVQLPPVPDQIFTREPTIALDPTTPTSLIACDISAELASRFPATTPLVLARYARIRAAAVVSDQLQVRALHPALGAEVRGVDMRTPLDPDTFRAVHDAWMQCLVLVFPGQQITDEEHVAFTRGFGEPEIFHQNIIRSRRVKEIFRVSNVDDEGNLMPPDHPTVRQVSLAQFWHTDSSYRTIPCTGALLHGVETSRTGGETQFTNMYAVYEALPDSLKRQVQGRKARHNFGHLHSLADLKPLTEEEKAAMPPVWQPLVRKHPVTGRHSLYISPIYNDDVEGMSQADAKRLIADLVEFAAEPRFVYRHRWEPHDVVMWDNRCTMHQVTPHNPHERRVMHRTTIVGTEPVLAA